MIQSSPQIVLMTSPNQVRSLGDCPTPRTHHPGSRLARAFIFLAFVVAASPISAYAQAQSSGTEATTLPFLLPAGVAYDSAGNMYVSDLDANVVQKVDTHGVITTIAGTGEQGFAGDNGPATSAILDSPAGIAVDSSGNIYIADSHNHRIREINASTGIITTIAGFSGDGGPATSAMLNLPLGIAIDPSGNIYIADTNNHRIREITGSTIATISGNGDQGYEGDSVPAISTGLDSPNGIALDSGLNVYISDTHNQRIRLLTVSTGIITTYAGNGARAYSGDSGAATSASLNQPRGIAVDSSGNVYIADSDNNRLRSVSSGTISTLAGTGEQGFAGDAGLAASAIFDTPRTAAAFISGGLASIALADANNGRIRVISSSTGSVYTTAGSTPTTLSLVLTGAITNVYGPGSLVATFYNSGKSAIGTITLLDGANTLSTGPISSNSATLAVPPLSAGIHNLVATYSGDANNPAVASGIFVLSVARLSITATANPASTLFGQPIPTLTGTLTGVLPSDSANVTAVFSSSAVQSSPVGIYPITVSLTGPAAANYTLSSATSSSVTISAAGSSTTLTSSSNSANLGTAVTLTATVASSTLGTPSGTVTILDGPTQIAAGTLSASGVFSFTTSALALGTHNLTAVYAATPNFTASTSPALGEVITAAPDFTINPGAGSASVSVSPGSAAAFVLNLAPSSTSFSNPITFSVTGLPTGATATFSPSSVTLSSSTANVTMTVQTAALAMQHRNDAIRGMIALALLLWPVFTRRRKMLGRLSLLSVLLLVLLGSAAAASMLAGCASGSGSSSSGSGSNPTQNPQTYTLTVTATSTSVTGASLQHTTTVLLTVQ